LRVAVVGLGLIGGSIALAARERAGADVTGWDADPLAVQTALTLGAISSGAGPLASAVAQADAVFLAAPVGELARLASQVLDHAPDTCVVTDVGSTKRSIVEAISDPRFVGGHPLAGAETSGIDNARPDLFAGSTWYLTPGARTGVETTAQVSALVRALGATVTELDAALHDRLMASVSHLPHVVANVLVSHLVAIGIPDVLGPSFRDATRVAGSNPAVWSAIYMDNRDELVAAIDDAVALLGEVRDKLERGDEAAVIQWCNDAAAQRARLGR
jgi:prephenate dehydrogenase